MNPFDLDPERLSTTSADGSRVYLHPASVQGSRRKWRDYVYSVLLIIFLVMPWLRIGGHPVLLLDLPRRHFSILGLTFWGHDAPMLFLVFLLFVVGIGLITAVFGRGWCGWACPQTVFIDRVFLRIERWIEGDAIAQRKLDESPWTAKKIVKRFLKWTLFLAASLVITHSFLAYFVGTDRLAQMVTRSPLENPASFLVIVIATAIILFDFGWFREQFCIIACPYGRLQSVLMDDHSLIVAYDEKRGEPRRQKGMAASQFADCVNCYRCVQVCPTGIDIRRGVQMECIACTACMDACDEVMMKINKPAGLIRYDTEVVMKGGKTQNVRTRTILYSVVLTAAAIILALIVSNREMIKVNFVHALDPFQMVQDGKEVINHYQAAVRNQDTRDAEIEFVLTDSRLVEKGKLVVPISPLKLPAGQSARTDLFLKFPRSILGAGSQTVSIEMRSSFKGSEKRVQRKNLPIVGPEES